MSHFRHLVRHFFCAVLLLPAALQAGGAAAPDFTLKSRSGENLKLSEYRGQVVMINFWASWCGPCRQEMPLLNDIYRRYHKLGFTLLGVNLDQERDQALALLEKIPVSFPILFDPEGKVSELYQVAAMPTTVILDRSGHVRHVHKGYLPGYEDKYQQQIRSLLRE